MKSSDDLYQTDAEIEAVVRGFESCETPPADFSHAAHLTVAFAYLHLSGLTVREATERLRVGLFRYLDYHGVDPQKYHETITQFWIKRVQAILLAQADTPRPGFEIANETIEACGPSQIIYDYYSRELLATEEARMGWVEPDLKDVNRES